MAVYSKAGGNNALIASGNNSLRDACVVFCFYFSFFLSFFFFFSHLFAFSLAAPAAYGGSPARGRMGAVAASLYHSHSSARSNEQGQGSNPHLHGY